MILLIIAAFFLSFLFQNFFSQISYLGVDWHQGCLNAAPISEFRVYYQALVCGQKLSHGHEAFDLRQLGLIHLFVVSGAHLHFVDHLISPLLRFLRFTRLRLPILFAFVLMAAFPVTAFRAWLFLGIRSVDDKWGLHFSLADQLLLSVLLCLFLFPEQFNSLALPLSWMACLGLLRGRNNFSRSLWIYLLNLPLLINIQALSPWTVVINGFVAPLIGTLLFPASLISFIFPMLSSLSDILWNLFIGWVHFFSPYLATNPLPPLSLSPLGLWIYCLGCHFGWVFIQRTRPCQNT